MADDRATRAASFQHTGADYHRLRPRYPEAAVDWMLPGNPTRVLDLGAGSGILTDSLIDRGLEVVAIDPSAQMLTVLRERHPGVETQIGTAEKINLPDGSVQAVVIGQAWHWMDAENASAEIGRVLSRGGSCAMVWNTENGDSDFERAFEAVQSSPRGLALAGERVPQPPLGEVEKKTFEWTRRIRVQDFVALKTTHSAWLTASAKEQAERMDRWQEIAAALPEWVEVGYTTEVWRTFTPA